MSHNSFHLFSTELAEQNKLPDLEVLESGRENQEAYLLFCSKFIPAVIGSQQFKKGCCTENLMKYCNISDEAMTFLILANNWEPWKAMIQLKNESNEKKGGSLEDCGVKQKYFKETKGRGHSWSKEGKLYYNRMFDKVQQDRQKNGESFDEYFLEYMNKESDEGKRLEKKEMERKKHGDDEEIVIRMEYIPPPLVGKRAASFERDNSDWDQLEREKQKRQAQIGGASEYEFC